MIDYQTYTLGNGLRVVHNYDPATSMVAVDVLYDVGARDEGRSLTGIAHLFEHLMFGGSVNVPDYDGELTAAAGNNNAWTSADFTNFHCQLPAANFDTALHLESDRMLSLSFNPQALQVQRSVVVVELIWRSSAEMMPTVTVPRSLSDSGLPMQIDHSPTCS